MERCRHCDLVVRSRFSSMSTTVLRAEDFGDVVAALDAWPDVQQSHEGVSTPVRRLVDALRDLRDDEESVGAADVAVLLRHVLRAEAESSGAAKTVLVPDHPRWPTAVDWRRFGVDAVPVNGRLRLSARPWIPEWLEATDDPAAAALRGRHEPEAGELPSLPADPFVMAATQHRRTHYSSAGQREAIRTLVAAQPGATVIANLPTGTGKSLVAYIMALMRRLGTVVVVVPTTSLALDQER